MTLAFGILAACVGVLAYDFLSGRCLLLDGAYRLALASRSLERWQRRSARAPAADVVVCLTSTPERIAHLGPTLKSLFAQSARPRAIRIHLPHRSRRSGLAYEVPAWLSRLEGVRLVRCEDHGPATKLLPALRDEPSGQPLLVVDDDKLYPPGFVAGFAAAALAAPDRVWGASGWRVPADLTDRPTTLLSNVLGRPPAPIKGTRVSRPRQVDVLQGYSGYLVRPRDLDLEALFAYDSAPEAAFFVDDVWISAHCRAPKYVLPARRYCLNVWSLAPLHRRTSLGRINRGGGDPERRNNTIVLRHLRTRWLCARAPGETRSPPAAAS